MAKDSKGEINLGLGELLGEANIVRAEVPEEPAQIQRSPSVEEPRPTEQPSAAADQIKNTDDVENTVLAVAPRHRPRRRFGVGLGVVIGCFLAAWILSGPGLDSEGGEVAVPAGLQAVPAISAPIAQPLDTGVLGGLIADLDRAGSPGTAAPAVLNPPAPNTPSQAPSVAPALNRSQINLKGPVEPVMIKEARETYRRNGGSEYANGQQDGASPFGPEKLPPFGGRRGKVIQGGETYRMLRHTRVFSEPDDRAAEISELFTGDRVLAEEKVGQWIKIRSQKGREGYIPLRVAEPLSEYYQRVPWEAPNGSLGR
jgi:hypothetical protein